MANDDSIRDISLDGAHTDFRDRANYADILCLDDLLACQKPISGRDDEMQHDEMLFIVIHQTSELWMKLALHELMAARERVRSDDIGAASKMLARVCRIFEQLAQGWDVLTTLTPADYMTFRARLGQASGLQSYQYRLIEFLLGGKNRAMLAPHGDRAAVHARLQTALAEPSLYDEVLRLLARRGFAIPTSHLERDWEEAYQPAEAIEVAWLQVYRETEAHWELYEIAEKLVDLEHGLDAWRYHHATTVERVIGYRRGTGGTSGVEYLRRALHRRFFPELWRCRTQL